MQDRPTAVEMLEAVAAFLEEDLMPTLTGRLSFHTRVAVNLLRILAREWQLEPGHRDADRAGMTALLGHDGDPQQLLDELAGELRSGQMDDRFGEVLSYLRQAALRKLEIASPRSPIL